MNPARDTPTPKVIENANASPAKAARARASQNFRAKNPSSRAPADAKISPLTVPSTVVNAIAEMIANSHSLMLLASSGAAMLLFVTSSEPLVIAPRPRYSVRT